MVFYCDYYYSKDRYLIFYENGVHVSFSDPAGDADPGASSLTSLLYGLPHQPGDVVVASDGGQLTQGELTGRVEELAEVLRAAGLRPGLPVGNLVAPGPAAIV